jgi:hypothetical protein
LQHGAAKWNGEERGFNTADLNNNDDLFLNKNIIIIALTVSTFLVNIVL